MDLSRTPDWTIGLAGCLCVLTLLALLPGPALIVALVILIAVVGMPHGGLDHLVGRALLRPRVGRHWLPTFLLGYLAIMAGMFVGWCLAPLPTLLGFVVLSALHFGTTDEQPQSLGQIAIACLRGGMVVWVPALARPAEFGQLLEWVVPGEQWADFLTMPITRWILGLALVLVTGLALASSAPERLRSLTFLTLFALTPSLVGFATYFCGWHSVNELSRLARQADSSNPLAGLKRVLVAAAPLSGAAVLLTFAGWWFVSSQEEVPASIVQTVFVGLSIVAVPHMLLHLVAEHRKVNPFTSEVGR